MQLSLFEDNQREILLNIAYEFVLGAAFGEVDSIYAQLLESKPDDQEICALRSELRYWHERLFGPQAQLHDPAALNSIWLEIDTIANLPLRRSVLKILIASLQCQALPEQIYYPPRFHLGQLLMEAGRFAEALDSFQAALGLPELPIGRFFSWCGDALTSLRRNKEALSCYLQALTCDPATVDLATVKNSTIQNLHQSLCFEAEEAFDAEDEAAWLPFWGWYKGVFDLPEPDGNSEKLLADSLLSVPRRWWLLLQLAESARTTSHDHHRMLELRRQMKKLNSFMFVRYLDRIRGN